nr:DUF1576 domain-containing protein [uncultured Acetatifactor sp.]
MAGKELKQFSILSALALACMAFVCDSPGNIVKGLRDIVISRDALITDYFLLGGQGAAFLNAALVMLVCIVLVCVSKIPFTGPTMAALFINAGYALWGKNPVNILPILVGTWLYARFHHAPFGRYIYTALFGTGLAPFITEMVYLLPFSLPVDIVLSVAVGMAIGFFLPPLSMHTASMHMGYSLFNVGFSAGLLAFVLVCVLEAFGMKSETVLMWREGSPAELAVGLYIYFVLAFAFGLYLARGDMKRLFGIFRHPGRAVADFVLMDGPGPALMNMALVGIVCVTYILLVGGDLSGPVVGAVWMAFGFAAFGAHPKNYLPVLAGVYLFNWVSRYEHGTPGIQLAALFGVGLAPIAGQFGRAAGVVAGMLHSAIVMCTAEMYGGLNLYNNGFSAGITAIFLVPVLDSFMRRHEYRKEKGK